MSKLKIILIDLSSYLVKEDTPKGLNIGQRAFKLKRIVL